MLNPLLSSLDVWARNVSVNVFLHPSREVEGAVPSREEEHRGMVGGERTWEGTQARSRRPPGLSLAQLDALGDAVRGLG